MKALIATMVLMLAAALPAQQQQQPNKSPDQLRDLAKQARSSGDLESEANYICQAAVQDTKKYGRKCDKAKEDVAKALDQFKADLNTGRKDLGNKDYTAALRDFGKVTFGPLKPQAQELMVQTRLESGTLSPEQVSQVALAAAGAAYIRGDFDKAESWLKRVQSSSLQAAASHLQTNINVYRDSMNQADALALKGDFKGAAQKYQFAALIRPNGPGQPLDHLRQALDAQEKADLKNAQKPPAESAPPPQAQVAANTKPAATNQASAENIKSKLATAHRQEAKGDIKGALQAYDAVLRNDKRQPDALAGKKRLLGQMKGDEKALEASLREGIEDFYSSQFAQASETIGNYLQQGGRAHEGAAHFYLGATLLSQAMLADPHNKADADVLLQQGREQLALAKQSHYVPVESAISPKILESWQQAGE